MAQVGFDARRTSGIPKPVGRSPSRPPPPTSRVDLVARLNAADGDVLGRCSGVGGMLKEATDTDPGAIPGLPIRSAASMSDSPTGVLLRQKTIRHCAIHRKLHRTVRRQSGVRVTETADWTPTFDRVSQIPVRTRSSRRRTLPEQQAWINKRNAADIAVSMGRVDTGDDFDPWASISNSWTEHTEAIATLEKSLCAELVARVSG